MQNHLVLGLSLWCNTNLQHQPSIADTPHFDQMPTSFYYLILQLKKKIAQQWPWNAIQFSLSIWLLKQSSFCVLKKGARRVFPSDKRASMAGRAQKSTFPKDIVVGRLEELDVVLHAAVGAFRLLQPIPQVLEAAFVSALCLHREHKTGSKGSNVHPVHLKLFPQSAEESQN